MEERGRGSGGKRERKRESERERLEEIEKLHELTSSTIVHGF